MRKKDSKQLSPKAELLAKTTKELLSRYGVNRVTIEEICSEAGVSRMTFYRYFPNKTAIIKYILSIIYSDIWEIMNSILKMNNPFEEKMVMILKAKWEYLENIGEEFLTELASAKDPVIKQLMEEEELKSKDQERKILEDAQDAGEIRSDINIDFLLHMVNVVRGVVRDEELQKLYPDISSFAKELFNFFYYGVLTKK